MDIHQIPLKEVFGKFDTSAQGLTYQQVQERQAESGYNIILEKKKKSHTLQFLMQMTNWFAIMLWVSASLSFLAEYKNPGEGMLYIGIALIVVIIINAVFTFYQEFKAEKAMDSFKDMVPSKAKVIRGGQLTEIYARGLVPGDIIVLAEGDKVPADARLFEENALKINNASLTGESEPQLRSVDPTHEHYLESRNLVFSGTLVQAGSGKAVVYATGMRTELGKIADLTHEVKESESTLHKEIKHFIRIISSIAFFLGILFFMLGLFIGNGFWGNLMFGIGVIVSCIPEGLLPTVTLSLSLASQKMARRNALIKSLESVETLGSTTVICTDKTGTLTQNNMHIKHLYINGDDFAFDEENHHHQYFSHHGKIVDVKKIAGLHRFIEASILCNNASLQEKPGKKAEMIGDPTEGALLFFARKLTDIFWFRQKHKRIHEVPFDAKSKWMITTNEVDETQMAFVKGAPEVLLSSCNKLLFSGKEIALTKAYQKTIAHQYELYAQLGYRVLAFGYKTLSQEHISHRELTQKNYVFVALAALQDPPRPEVHDAVATCKKAGIKIIIISGDASNTVASIAKQVGIIASDTSLIITGEELEKMDHEELKQKLKQEEVLFARTSPMHKLRVVEALQELGEVVAVTGDGVNDAPALKKADIGVAMGIAGTDVAKEAADMILVDDNFATIVNAVEEGRTIFDNIKRFIVYVVAHNIPELLAFIASVVLGLPLPITVILILSIDLGTDILPAIALGTEKHEPDIMNRPPRKKSDRLLTGEMLMRSFFTGLLETFAGFISYFYVLFIGGWQWGMKLSSSDILYHQAVAAFFLAIVVCQMVNVLVCRTHRTSLLTAGIFTNRYVIYGILSMVLLGGIIVYLPYTHTFFNTAPISPIVLFISIPFALLILAVEEHRKYLVRKRESKTVLSI
ncbi:cation-transporting P-type ATPase [Candidatus Woesearchaeota archaeon]|nr:cation-transporting P-type ATPase [Candidatus Woesearchaeota archaeon]